MKTTTKIRMFFRAYFKVLKEFGMLMLKGPLWHLSAFFLFILSPIFLAYYVAKELVKQMKSLK